MSNKRSPRILEVRNSERITPNMQRITLGGADMADFPEQHESANFKLVLPQNGQQLDQLSDDDKPVVRTYTLRKYHAARNELEVDFALHDGPGPATSWAINARVGDSVGFRGPGKPKLMNTDADWYLLAGDMSALPAISALLEILPDSCQGYAILEVVSEEDRQNLSHPPGIEISWLVNPHPTQSNSLLVDAVTSIDWREGQASVWVAGESAAVREMRQYFRNERGIDREFLYASGYWQIGLTEDKHQLVKRQEKD